MLRDGTRAGGELSPWERAPSCTPPLSSIRRANRLLFGQYLDRPSRLNWAPARLYSGLPRLPHGLRHPSPVRLEHLVIRYGSRHGRSEQQHGRR